MYRITRKGGTLILHLRSYNGKELYVKKFTQKHSIWKHIQILLKTTGSKGVVVQDEVIKNGVPQVLVVTQGKVKLTGMKPKKLKP